MVHFWHRVYLSTMMIFWRLVLSALLISSVWGCSISGRMDSCGELIPNSFARGFALYDCGADTLLVLYNPDNRQDTLFTWRSGKPLERLASISTTHVPYLRALNRMHWLVGMGADAYVRDDSLKAMLKSGSVKRISVGNELNFEVTIASNPDALLVYPYGNTSYDAYREAGILVVPISEYAEQHPLGRAEWLKVFGLLTGSWELALEHYDEMEAEYLLFRDALAEEAERPTVFAGSYYKGQWAAPSGESLMAQLLADAGAEYAFASHQGSENISLDFEKVLASIGGADFFGKVLHHKGAVTRDALMEEQERFQLLSRFEDGRIFYCNTAERDYFERGVLEPHLMLRDLGMIFHPERIGPHPVHYFETLQPVDSSDEP
ncbi:MAG: hypothetical protein EA392_14725 [Cryomorphaceae bacterium]|nr:MAG: hypothetical protein EA392_14725 [Cryomorphaceae bacterium]